MSENLTERSGKFKPSFKSYCDVSKSYKEIIALIYCDWDLVDSYDGY